MRWGASCAWLAGVCAACLGAGAAAAQAGDESGRAAKAALWHVRVSGDLDSVQVARDVLAELERARGAGAGVVVLELGGNRWRTDVVWAVAEGVKRLGAERVRALVYLSDGGDGRVGLGQAAIGGAAEACYASPRTVISGGPEDDLRGWAPEGVDWERAERELQGWMWSSLRRRGADTGLVEALLWPGAAVWAGPAPGSGDGAGGAWVLHAERPEGAAGDALVAICRPAGVAAPLSAESRAWRVELSAEVAEKLRLVNGTARGIGEVLSAERLVVQSRTVRDAESRLGAARERVVRLVSEVDRLAERAEHRMKDVPGRSAGDYRQKRERAGREASAMLGDAAAAIAAIEGLIEEFPELVRMPVPGRTTVAAPVDPAALGAEWRWAVQRRRDSVERLAARAREFTGG